MFANRLFGVVVMDPGKVPPDHQYQSSNHFG
jgi:hypothetical protein